MGQGETSRCSDTREAEQSEETASGDGSVSGRPERPAPPELRDPKAQVIWEAEYAARMAEANRLVTLLKYIDIQAEPVRREGGANYESMQSREAPPEALRLCAQTAQNAVATAEDAAIMYAAEALNLSEHHVSGLYSAAQVPALGCPECGGHSAKDE